MEQSSRPRAMSVVAETLQPSNIAILLVEDDKVARMLGKKLLTSCGYQVDTAEDGQIAWGKLKDENKPPFDLVISDVYMPNLDGLGLLTKIRADQEIGEMAVIMISSAQDLDIVAKCVRAGADDFIVKPARVENIRNVWQSVWRRRKEHRLLTLLSAEQQSKDQLQGQIHNLESKMTEAVETPINVIMKTVHDLSSLKGLTPEVQSAIAQVIRSLNSNNLYRPVMQKRVDHNSGDRRTREWLSSVLDIENVRDDSPTASTDDSAAIALTPRQAGGERVPRTWSHTSLAIDIEQLRSWEFDQWEYKEEQLLEFLLHMFEDLGCLDHFDIDQSKLHAFLVCIRNHYQSRNPYHNFRHAFDVAHGVFVMLTTGKASTLLGSLDIFALLTAAICHDVDHPGTNNNYQVAVQSKLALRYNDKSVLESHHSSLSFRLLKDPDMNILEHLTPAQTKEFRQTMIHCVLATDLAQHVEFDAKLQAMCDKKFKQTDRDDRLLLAACILKAADISNAVKPYSLAKYWSDLVLEEFFQQGDQEVRQCLPISPFMDRTQRSQGRMSIGFIDFIVRPFYTKVATVLEPMHFCLDLLAENRQRWSLILKEEEELARAAKDASVVV